MGFISNILNGGGQGQVNAVSGADAAAAQANVQKNFQDQQALLALLQGQNAVQNQSSVFNQQQNLANLLMGQATGQSTIPSVAQTQLATSTGQNVAAQGALAAGARGAAANPGLAARNAAIAGTNAMQTAAGQGATLAAQEQNAAIQNLQNQQNMMGNLSTNQVGQQANLINAGNQASLGNQGQIFGQVSQQNAQNAQRDQFAGGVLGGLINAAGPAIIGSFLGPAAPVAAGMAGGGGGGLGSSLMAFNAGGEVPTVSGPKSKFGQHLNMQHGGHVPGQPNVAGDHPSNDTVPAMLSPGEFVIPRTIMQSPNAPKKAAEFIAAHMAKKRK